MARIRRIFGNLGDAVSDWSDSTPLPAGIDAGLTAPDTSSMPSTETLDTITVTAPPFPWATIVIGLALAAYFAFFYSSKPAKRKGRARR